MSSLWSRSLDIYRLRAGYRYLIGAFLLAGLLLGFWPAVAWAREAQLARGLTPGTPLGSEQGSVQFLLLALAFLLSGGVLGMALGAFVLCVVLTALSDISFRAALRAIFLSYYPAHWFAE
ncbi:hypothetical protein [Cognatilysobacter terrigena]|uniref:hypothetical protein n=1 Tax=Cognatilysobacter terrigena TaxID=2488749 RepID=UPI00105D8155|nr:hypothetical protein [Lysobacter terrigena]